MTDATWVIGVHPSNLPEFAGGSPIQNQILSGVSDTKMTLFRMTAKLDEGPILAKLPLSLNGHMHEIFERLTLTSLLLFADFLRNFPNIKLLPNSGPQENIRLYSRLPPSASQLSRDDLAKKSARDLYNLIRSHEDPYPNCYFEDDSGRIIFKLCEFTENQ